MLKSFIIGILFLPALAFGQQEPKQQSSDQPQVKMNYLNVCTPSPDEQAVIRNAFAKVQTKPTFGRDYEISRGLATMKDSPDSKFVRLRRDLAPDSVLLTAQYSMSTDRTSTVETMVLRMRDPKEFHEVSLEDRVSAGAASPVSLLTVDTPVSRIRLERLGKGSVVLARCEGADQSAYEPLFRQASEIMAQYRKALALGSMIGSDVAWLSAPAKAAGQGQGRKSAK